MKISHNHSHVNIIFDTTQLLSIEGDMLLALVTQIALVQSPAGVTVLHELDMTSTLSPVLYY